MVKDDSTDSGSIAKSHRTESRQQSENILHRTVESSEDSGGRLGKYESDDGMKNRRKRMMDQTQRFLSIDKTPNDEGGSAEVEGEPTFWIKMIADSEEWGKEVMVAICAEIDAKEYLK